MIEAKETKLIETEILNFLDSDKALKNIKITFDNIFSMLIMRFKLDDIIQAKSNDELMRIPKGIFYDTHHKSLTFTPISNQTIFLVNIDSDAIKSNKKLIADCESGGPVSKEAIILLRDNIKSGAEATLSDNFIRLMSNDTSVDILDKISSGYRISSEFTLAEIAHSINEDSAYVMNVDDLIMELLELNDNEITEKLVGCHGIDVYFDESQSELFLDKKYETFGHIFEEFAYGHMSYEEFYRRRSRITFDVNPDMREFITDDIVKQVINQLSDSHKSPQEQYMDFFIKSNRGDFLNLNYKVIKMLGLKDVYTSVRVDKSASKCVLTLDELREQHKHSAYDSLKLIRGVGRRDNHYIAKNDIEKIKEYNRFLQLALKNNNQANVFERSAADKALEEVIQSPIDISNMTKLKQGGVTFYFA